MVFDQDNFYCTCTAAWTSTRGSAVPHHNIPCPHEPMQERGRDWFRRVKKVKKVKKG